MNINELDELAKSVTGWSNCDKAWLDTSEDTPAAVFGSIDEDGNTYPVAIVDCEQYFAASDSLKLAKFYAATNPSAVLELIAAYRESVAVIKGSNCMCFSGCEICEKWPTNEQALTTAKRLGIE